jgi:UDP-N-acetylmuramoyl-tripeptide--D-alanyl-D-alanine ligase
MKDTFKKLIVSILKIESRLVLWKYKPKVIAITGSVGKTSTKDAVYAVLSKVSYVRKSEKSFNSEIGLPLTILGAPNGWNNPFIWLANIWRGFWLFIYPHKYPKWLVLEVGISKPGNMREVVSWLKTDAVIITAIGETPAHIEFFASRKHLVEEKSLLIKTLKKDGLLVLNADDETVLNMKNSPKNITITYGFKEDVDIMGSGDSIFYNDKNVPEGIIFRVDTEGKSLPVVIDGVFGRNHIYASLAALAISSGLKFNMLEAVEALKNYDVPPGRMRLLKGINETLIIDDTYNSSPFACESALKTLREVKITGLPAVAGRKIAILGDMLELGKYTSEAHKNIGKIAKENADILIVVGQRAKAIKEGALEAGMGGEIFEFLDSREAGNFIKDFVQKNDLILVKGSQGMRMERTVEAILLDQGNKEKLLVRQDEEWLKKK